MNKCDRFEWERLVKSADALTGRMVHTALALATYADPDGSRVRPGVELLADDCRCSVATVRRALKVLESFGLLHKVTRGGGWTAAGGLATEWQLVWPSAEQLASLDLRVPGERRRYRLSAHDVSGEGPGEPPVDSGTHRSPACGESGTNEGTLRSSGEDSPLTGDRLSAHPDEQVPEDHPRPDEQVPPADDDENESSPEPTRAREPIASHAERRRIAMTALGSRGDRKLPSGRTWAPLRRGQLGDAEFDQLVAHILAEFVQSERVYPSWWQGNREQHRDVWRQVRAEMLRRQVAAEPNGPASAEEVA